MAFLDYMIIILALALWGLVFFLAYKILRFAFRLVTGKVAVRESLLRLRAAYRAEMERQQVIIEQKRLEKLQKPKKVRPKKIRMKFWADDWPHPINVWLYPH